MQRKANPEMRQRVEIVSATPFIGMGNPTETAAITNELTQAGLEIVAHYPTGFMITAGSVFHTLMSASTKRTMDYAEHSTQTRESTLAKPLIFQLRLFVKSMLAKYPNAQFFLTPQNVLGEQATEVELGGRKFCVIMILPDAMGKLSPLREPNQQQRAISYLVWNEQAYQVMKEQWRLDVQLINLVDPLQGFPQLNQQQTEYLGLPELFEQENLCICKLSGSGGDPKLITEIIEALWKNSKIKSIVFPGKSHTGMNIALRTWLSGTWLNPKKTDTPKVKWSLDEGLFYNAARQMNHAEQLLLTYPSEQVKHSMVLSENGLQPRIVWLPPRGEHEVLNLVHYMYLTQQQNLVTTICIPSEYQDALQKKLQAYRFQANVEYRMVEPKHITKEHFYAAPVWKAKLPRVSAEDAVHSIMGRHK